MYRDALFRLSSPRTSMSCTRSVTIAAALFWLATAMPAPAVADEPAGPSSINLWQKGDPGQPMQIRGVVMDANGAPVAGARIFIRQADATGEYQPDRYTGELYSGPDGSYSFSTVLPGQYYGEKHIHLMAGHDAHGVVERRMVFKNDPNLASPVEDAIHLEEANVGEIKVLFGRYDIRLAP
ncbi:MAG: hypothetical protein ACR2RL_10595 [Gammaproteobacteria bacterium]